MLSKCWPKYHGSIQNFLLIIFIFWIMVIPYMQIWKIYWYIWLPLKTLFLGGSDTIESLIFWVCHQMTKSFFCILFKYARPIQRKLPVYKMQVMTENHSYKPQPKTSHEYYFDQAWQLEIKKNIKFTLWRLIKNV